MLAAAADARGRSYSPYSKFRAGAAVLTDDGEIVEGVIVENVSLGLAMCAERTAMFATVARGQKPVALALVAPDTTGDVTWPCGACLQVALELGGPDLVVTAADAGESLPDDPPSATVRQLAPRAPHRDRPPS